jgi:hypothetical protein
MWKGLLLSGVALLSAGCAPLMHSPFVGAPRTRAPHMGGPAAMAPAPLALPFGRWDNVMRVPPMSVLDVLDSHGAAHVGQILSADAQQVKLLVRGSEVTLARAEVVRVDLVRAAGAASGIGRVARGALLGAGAAVLFGAVVGGEAWPPPGALVRGGAAIGGLSGSQAAALDRQGQILYIAPY